MLALIIALQASGVDAAHLDIPLAFRGHWALEQRLCRDFGPASVVIGARTIDFYERHGFLKLAQLNFAPAVPSFYGSFEFVENLRFSSGVVRLEISPGGLLISEVDDPEKSGNDIPWFRCP